MKLWDKGFTEDEKIDKFTVGHDREMDLYLAQYDILGTMAHITMLESVGLLEKSELDVLLKELKALYKEASEGKFVIEDDVEDVHSQVELMLTRKLGDIGKKVHTGRSRNDQIMVDVKLYARAEIEKTVGKMQSLFEELQAKSEQYKDILIPGYTHLQVAMPSSFGLWFGAYAESLADDMIMLKAAWDVTNQNPLGAAAGYGSSAPLNRTLTTKLLGFADMDYNVVYAQMGRGKTERMISFALASVAETIGRLAMDGCMYTSQNFGFIKLPKAMTTGSSIMPHKKNPDVFELIRAHCKAYHWRDPFKDCSLWYYDYKSCGIGIIVSAYFVPYPETISGIVHTKDARHATIDIPYKYVNTIEKGMKVFVKFEGYDAESYGVSNGTVTEISRTPRQSVNGDLFTAQLSITDSNIK